MLHGEHRVLDGPQEVRDGSEAQSLALLQVRVRADGVVAQRLLTAVVRRLWQRKHMAGHQVLFQVSNKLQLQIQL